MKDPNAKVWDEFRAKERAEQRQIILSIAKLCIDAAPVGLARRIEIYFEGQS